MSVTRQSLRFKCSVKDCPWPKDEEIHVPWCLGIPNVEHWADKPTHQHFPKKGMGGKNPKSKIVAILCVTCHDRIDNGDWGNAANHIPGRGKVYFAWDLHGNTLIERDIDGQESPRPAASPEEGSGDTEGVTGAQQESEAAEEEAPVLSDDYLCPHVGPVLSAAAEAAKSGSIIESGRGDEGEADPTLPRGSEGTIKPNSVATHTSAAALSAGLPTISKSQAKRLAIQRGTKEESDGHKPDTDTDVRRDNLARRQPDDSLPGLTHEQRVAIAQEIKDSEWQRQWRAGDTANAWEAEMGTEAWQYISDFGYQPESMSNVMYVCESIPKNMRRAELRFSHHVVMLGLNREDMEMWLDKCEENQWSVAEFRRQVKGTKPKVKKYRLEELYELGRRFGEEYSYVGPYIKFLDWLGEQG
jgi:hypothetical protein